MQTKALMKIALLSHFKNTHTTDAVETLNCAGHWPLNEWMCYHKQPDEIYI